VDVRQDEIALSLLVRRPVNGSGCTPPPASDPSYSRRTSEAGYGRSVARAESDSLGIGAALIGQFGEKLCQLLEITYF